MIETMVSSFHIPVLLEESIAALRVQPGGSSLLGAEQKGGHAVSMFC